MDSPHTFLRARRSIRRFLNTPIAQDKLERILTTAGFAPSAHGRQPWRFAVLTTDSPKALLADKMSEAFIRDLTKDKLPQEEINKRVEISRNRILQAPIVIILCMDASEMDEYPDPTRQKAEMNMAIQSTAAAGLQLMLAAEAEGLNSVWTCGPLFTPKTVSKTLKLPKSWQPQAMIFLGYSDIEPKPKNIKPLTETTLFIT